MTKLIRPKQTLKESTKNNEENSGRKKSQRIREAKLTAKGQVYYEQMRQKNMRKKNKDLKKSLNQVLKESRNNSMN